VILFFASLIGIDLALAPDMSRAEAVSTAVTDRSGALLRVFPVDDGRWRLKADLSRTDPDFLEALIFYEDQRFYLHPGVDGGALVRALASWVVSGSVVSGGSTLTMQTARLLEPRARTVPSKLIEIARALQLERRLSKKEILELYLTLAPYGGNLEGVRAASIAYFGREPDQLSADQIALLVALPQSPEARRPDLRAAASVRARGRVLARLAGGSLFAPDLAAESAEYPAPKRRDFPSLAWHASEEARRREPGASDIRMTLDIGLQTEIETLLANLGREAGGGSQAAAMVVQIDTREVRAAVGSAGRSIPGGWLDLTNRRRSPGSTLKPFIYGLAFDDGIAAASTRISDAPRRFDSYRPENFDRTFRGEVSVAEALQHSLNVPAVSALNAVGANRFSAALAFSGAEVLPPLSTGEDAGLAIALGGVGMTVRELAALYAALGDGGRARPLIWTSGERADAALAQLMSAESAREILEILAGSPAPPGRMPARLTLDAPRVAYKTGTSYGFRDAWAAGVGAGHVVIVWIGRADGAPRAGVTGRDAALPVLFDIFDMVVRNLPYETSGEAISGAEEEADTPAPMAVFEAGDTPPHILFPPDESEIWFDDEHRVFSLSAQSRRSVSWYVDGRLLPAGRTGQVLWRPAGPGFYELQAVDSDGRTAVSRVRVKSPDH